MTWSRKRFAPIPIANHINKDKKKMSKKLHEFKVNVCRIGYGNRDLTIFAPGYADARSGALETAGNHQFSEHTSEYAINTITSETCKNIELFFSLDEIKAAIRKLPDPPKKISTARTQNRGLR